MNLRMFFLILLLFVFLKVQAGKKLRVLFIGNSYTYVNNMPQIVSDIASSMGDTLIWDMEAPGGAFLLDHYSTNPPNTINKIKVGHWNYVVMQEQSMQTAVPDIHMNASFLPAGKLDSLINLYNDCAETIFYQTWGRKNGDSFACKHYSTNHNWPYFCTYNTMDSLIRLRYRKLADTNNAIIAPVGAVWRYIRNTYPNVELYDVDESHPSYAGSYAAACALYTTMFRRIPTNITFNGSLNSTYAINIKTAVKSIVYDSMTYWHIGQYRTEAMFVRNINSSAVSFDNFSVNANKYYWNFGDGQTSSITNPVHTYNNPGSYNVKFVATNTTTGCNDTAYSVVNIFPTNTIEISKHNQLIIFPNPTQGRFTINIPNVNTRVIIKDIFGRTVYTASSNSNLLVDMNDVSIGLYIVHISSILGKEDIKLVIQH